MLERPRRITLAGVTTAVALTLPACDVEEPGAPAEEQAEEEPVPPDDPDGADGDGSAVDDVPASAADAPDGEAAEDAQADADALGTGMVAGSAEATVDEAVAAVEVAVDDSTPEVAYDVDHAATAQAAGTTLPPTRLLAIADPATAAPLLREAPLLGLDLPTRLLAWEAGEVVQVAVNDPFYLAERHELAPGPEEVVVLDETQRGLLDVAGASQLPAEGEPGDVPEGLEVIDSDEDFDTTLERARGAVEDASVSSIAEVDHAAAADEVDLQLDPNTLLVFGSAPADAPLIADQRSAAIDLPHRLLIYHEDGRVRVAYDDPRYVQTRHELTGVDEQVAEVADVLAELAETAAGG